MGEILSIKPGQELIHKESNIVYVIQNVKQKNVILVSKDGEAGMSVHQDSSLLAGFEPVFD